MHRGGQGRTAIAWLLSSDVFPSALSTCTVHTYLTYVVRVCVSNTDTVYLYITYSRSSNTVIVCLQLERERQTAVRKFGCQLISSESDP